MRHESFSTMSQQIHDAAYDHLGKYCNHLQWAFRSPRNSPRKREIVRAIKERGTPGCHTNDRGGWNYILKVLGPWAFAVAQGKPLPEPKKPRRGKSRKRPERTKLYYCSHENWILAYIDIDRHQPHQSWQDCENTRLAIDTWARDHGIAIYWIKSARGYNGYIKIAAWGSPPENSNYVLGRLWGALKRVISAASADVADLEICGQVGYLKDDGTWKWGKYGKLPIHSLDFNLEAMRKNPEITMTRLEVVVEEAMTTLSPPKARMPGPFIKLTPTLQKKLEANPLLHREAMTDSITDDEGTFWVRRDVVKPPKAPAPAVNQPEKPNLIAIDVAESSNTGKSDPRIIARVPDELRDEPDSFRRQLYGVLPLARKLKRVPTVEEAELHIKANCLFSGDWEDNQAARTRRIEWIIKYIAQTFDPAKCSKGQIELGKFDAYVRQRFPEGICFEESRLNQDGETYRRETFVDCDWISKALGIIDHALTDRNQDQSLPQERAKQHWLAIYKTGWDDQKWKAVRETLSKSEVVKIIDRTYYPGQAMKWDWGAFFPGRHNYADVLPQRGISAEYSFPSEKEKENKLNPLPSLLRLNFQNNMLEIVIRPPP